MNPGSQSAGPTPASTVLAHGIVAATAMLVRAALRGDWSELSVIVLHRRLLLQRLAMSGNEEERACLRALQQAVEESDDALHTICPRRLH